MTTPTPSPTPVRAQLRLGTPATASGPGLTPRQHAREVLALAGFGTGTMVTTQIGIVAPLQVVLIATAEMESDLYVDAQGPPNSNGTVDRGWLQINSVHKFDDARILRDAQYTADCAFDIYSRQGLRAWSAYGKQWPEETPDFRYLRRMPPAYGGAIIVPNPTGRAANDQRELVRDVQSFLNGRFPLKTALKVDGGFGSVTRTRLLEWKKAHHNDGHDRIDARTWLAMVNQGLR